MVDHRNDRTTILYVERQPKPLLGTGGPLCADELERLEEDRARHPSLPAAAVIVRWRGHSEQAVFFHTGDGIPQALVIGRHNQCDVFPVPGASLRHALLLLWPPDADESPWMECIDLKTGSGIGLGESEPVLHVVGRGHLHFWVGVAHIVVLQVKAGERLCPDSPEALAKDIEQGDLSIEGRPESGPFGVGAEDRRAPALGQPGTMTVHGEMLAQLRGERWQSSSSIGALRLNGVGESLIDHRTIDLENPICVPVRPKDLIRGVLLGRYPRCRGSSELCQSEEISRVHACVLVRSGELWAIDCGSTNGMTIVAEHGRNVELGPRERVGRLREGERLRLAGRDVFLVVTR